MKEKDLFHKYKLLMIVVFLGATFFIANNNVLAADNVAGTTDDWCVSWPDGSASSAIYVIPSGGSFSPQEGYTYYYKYYRNTSDNFASASLIFTTPSFKKTNSWDEAMQMFQQLIYLDSNIIPNTRYYYWIELYDQNNNYIDKSNSFSHYAPRNNSEVTGVTSKKATGDKFCNGESCWYNVAILWQWDNYPGANGYYFEGSSDNLEIPNSYTSSDTNVDSDSLVDQYSYAIPSDSSDTSFFDMWTGAWSNLDEMINQIDYSRPYYIYFNVYVEESEISNPYKLIIRPTFSSEGTILCGKAGQSSVTPTIPTSQPPGTPQNLQHTSNTESSITWEWQAGSGGDVDHYIVYNSKGTLLDSTVSGTTYTWEGLEFPNTQYGIKVVAVNSNGTSDATDISYAYTSIEQPSSVSCVATKTSLAVTANGTISDPSPSNQYLSKIAFSKNGAYSAWQEDKSITYSSLTCSTTYTIQAKTRNGDGEERSAIASTCSTQSCNSGPDLIIDSITFPNEICQGDLATGSVVTKNIGTATTGQTSKTKVFIDSNDIGAGGIATLLDVWVNILTAGSTQTKTLSSWNTTGVSLGQHNVVAIADAPNDSRITEANENNNVLRKTVTVTNCTPGGPGSFSLISPENNGTGVDTTPVLDWQDASGATSFYVYFCEGAGCTLSLLDSTANDQYTISTALKYNTTYSWNVVAWDGTNSTYAVNGPFTFTTMAEKFNGTPPTANYDWCKINSNTIQFLDRSTPGDSPLNAWEYNFGDGEKCLLSCSETGYSGTNKNPVHTFTNTTPVYTSPDYGWYSTLDSGSEVSSPEAGTAGTVVGSPTYTTGVNGNAMVVDQNSEGAKIPINSTNFNYIKGAIQMSYKPAYASNSGEPNHYLWRADGPTGDSFELKYQNNGLYYKINDADASTQCVVSAINISPGWTANQWLKLVATWDQTANPKMSLSVYDQTTGNLLNSWTNTSCTMVFSTAITLTDMYIGTWVGGTYNAKGAVDDFMMFLRDDYTATLAGGSTVSLKATAENGGTNTYTETLDLLNGPSCAYNLTSLSASNCHTVNLTWQALTSLAVDGYDIYRSTSASGPWILAKAGATGTTYSDYNATDIKENVKYYYYISTSPISLNNSTVSPACTGGFGSGTKCPLNVTTPICPIDDFRLSTVRKCGSITFRFAAIENAKAYEVRRSAGNNTNYTTVLTINSGNMSTYCNSNYCSYEDKEVLPVNTINPLSKFKYWYQARAQAQDDSWTNWSTEISDYSYCYRAKEWQER